MYPHPHEIYGGRQALVGSGDSNISEFSPWQATLDQQQSACAICNQRDQKSIISCSVCKNNYHLFCLPLNTQVHPHNTGWKCMLHFCHICGPEVVANEKDLERCAQCSTSFCRHHVNSEAPGADPSRRFVCISCKRKNLHTSLTGRPQLHGVVPTEVPSLFPEPQERTNKTVGSAELVSAVKSALVILQKNQKDLAADIEMSTTTVSAYLTLKTRAKGWAKIERRMVVWLLKQQVQPNTDYKAPDFEKNCERLRQLQGKIETWARSRQIPIPDPFNSTSSAQKGNTIDSTTHFGMSYSNSVSAEAKPISNPVPVLPRFVSINPTNMAQQDEVMTGQDKYPTWNTQMQSLDVRPQPQLQIPNPEIEYQMPNYTHAYNYPYYTPNYGYYNSDNWSGVPINQSPSVVHHSKSDVAEDTRAQQAYQSSIDIMNFRRSVKKNFPKLPSNKYFEEQQKLNKRRVSEQNFSSEEDSENGQTAEPDPTLLQKLKEIMRTLQKNQKSLSYELNVSATTISAYFTAKRRSKGWTSFERRLVQWITGQNMDSALVENPGDEDLLQAVETCKEIQRSLREEDNNHIQPTPTAKITPLNLSKIPNRMQQPPTLELPQTMPESRFEGRSSSRQYFVTDADTQFQYRPQVIMPTQGRRNSWLCLTDVAPSESVPMEASEVQFESYYNTPYVNYNSDGKSDAVDYYGDMGFDLSFTKHAQNFAPQYDYTTQQYYY